MSFLDFLSAVSPADETIGRDEELSNCAIFERFPSLLLLVGFSFFLSSSWLGFASGVVIFFPTRKKKP